MKNQLYFILILNLIFGSQTQVPYSFLNSLEEINPIILPEVDIELLLEQDSESDSNTPYRYGEKISVNTNYTRSINIERDSNSPSVISSYIPTNRTLSTLKQISLSNE